MRIVLNALATFLFSGDRLRLAFSTSYRSRAWPAPEPVTLVVSPAGARSRYWCALP